MYTSHIGKKFIQLYNRKNNTEHTAKEFFNEVYFPIFFDNAKFLLSPANTPLFQLIAQRKTGDPVARQAELMKLHAKVEAFQTSSALIPDMSFAVGYGSADDSGTTSGQISSFKLPITDEDAYASWIGGCLGIGVGGGQNILIDDDEVLWAVFEGWKIYREYVNQTEGIENKIDTWNGVWLNHRFSVDYNPIAPTNMFEPVTPDKDGKAKMERPSWVQILFALSQSIQQSTIQFYVYQFSQMNTTYGMVQAQVGSVRSIFDLYKTLFPNEAISPKKLAELYETEWGFSTACQSGVIGLKQIEPKGLRKFMSGAEKIPTTKEYDKSPITFNMYYLWIIAMLNNKEFLDLAVETARTLHVYVAGGQRGKSTRGNEVSAVLEAKTKRAFAEALSILVEEDTTVAKALNKTLDAVHLDIPPDNVLYFITLVKFKYALPEQLLNNN